ncbi:MAG: TonB-dependent receptor [bacterium]
MKKSRYYIVVITLICAISMSTQTTFASIIQDSYTGTIKGTVIDKSTRSPLIGVNILVQETDLGCAADSAGKFLIPDIPSGIHTLQFTMIGYEKRKINRVTVNPHRTTWLKVELKPTVLQGENVVVTAGFFQKAKDGIVSNRSVNYEEIRSDPGSAADIQRVMQLLPAVVSGSDQYNEIIVRGGMPGENLFLMDHIEIPNPNHFGEQGTGGGPINMVNAHMVQGIDFFAGAFPARYGDKASSVMDISLREGNRERITGHGFLGMSGAGLMLEGPLNRGKGSYILSASKSFLDLIISSTGLTAVPQYYNLQGKIVYDLNKNNTLIFNGIYGDDKIIIEENQEDGDDSGGSENVRSLSHQYALGVTLRTLLGRKGFSLITASQTLNHWNLDVYYNNGISYYVNKSQEIERTLKAEITYLPVKKLELNLGAQIKSIPFDIYRWAEEDTIFVYDTTVDPPEKTEVFQTYDAFLSSVKKTTFKAAGFGQLKWSPHPNITATLGLRTDYFDYTGKTVFDPRLGLSFQLDQTTRLNCAFGRHSQAPAYVEVSAHPENNDLKHKFTQQVVLGIEHLFRDDMRGTLEVFYKDYDQVPLAKSSLSPDPYDYYYGRMVNEGKGFAKGIEFFLQKKRTGNYHFTVSYSWSVSKAYDPRYNRTYAWDYDYGHVFTLVTGLNFDLHNKQWYKKFSKTFFYKCFAWMLPLADQVEFALRWRYLGGRPYTEPIYYPQFRGWLVDESVSMNAQRYPPYHRLDLRLDRRYMFKGWNMVVFFDIMNVYGRDNIWRYSYNDDGSKEKILQFQVFPVGGVIFEF